MTDREPSGSLSFGPIGRLLFPDRVRIGRAPNERLRAMAGENNETGAVDVTAAVAQLDSTIEALSAEIETDENALGVKRARLDALKRGRKGLEAAADPDIQPRKRPGRKRAEATA